MQHCWILSILLVSELTAISNSHLKKKKKSEKQISVLPLTTGGTDAAQLQNHDEHWL